MAGSAAIRLSICINIFSVRSCEVPGGRSTVAIIVPVSSFGTSPVGVTFIIKMSNAIDPTTRPKVKYGLWMKCRVPFLYFLSKRSYDSLKAVWNLLINVLFLFWSGSCGFRNNAHSAGLSVKAFNADKPMAIAMVKPN